MKKLLLLIILLTFTAGPVLAEGNSDLQTNLEGLKSLVKAVPDKDLVESTDLSSKTPSAPKSAKPIGFSGSLLQNTAAPKAKDNIEKDPQQVH